MLLFLCLFLLGVIALIRCFRRFRGNRKEAAPDYSYIIWKDYARSVPDQVEESSEATTRSAAVPAATEEKTVPADAGQSSAIKAVLDFEDTGS